MLKSRKLMVFAIALLFVLCAGCAPGGSEGTPMNPPVSGGQTSETLEADIIVTSVGKSVPITIRNAQKGETFSYRFENDDIYIDEATSEVEGMLAGTVTKVFVTGSSGRSGEFDVRVEEDLFSEGKGSDEVVSSDLFDEIEVDPISGLAPDVPLGIDISEVYENQANGAKYYNADGVRQNVYQILKDSGVNYVRIRLVGRSL